MSAPERNALRATDSAYATAKADSRPDASSTKISVITTAYNAESTILETLEGFATQTADPATYELVVVDDCSTDQTLATAIAFAEAHPELVVLVIAMGQNVGAARARSVAVDLARSALVAFFDADDAPNHGYIEAHLSAQATAGTDAVITCGALTTSYFANPSSAVAARLQVSGVGSIFGSVPWAGGGTVAMPVEVYNRLGGTDPSMIGAEDLDFSVRAWLHGIPLVFVPAAVCHYRQRTKIRSALRQRRVYGRGQVALVRKYWPIINRRQYAYWQLRGLLRLPRQLSKAAIQACQSDRGRYAAADRVGLIRGYLSGSMTQRLFVLCPFGEMLNRPADDFDLDVF